MRSGGACSPAGATRGSDAFGSYHPALVFSFFACAIVLGMFVRNPAFLAVKTASANPLQVWMYVGTVVWLAGTAALLLYALAAYVAIKWKVRASVRTEKNIYECDDIADPFTDV